MEIVSRADWGARHERGFGPAPLPADEVWLHHSVTIAPDLVPPFDDEHAAMRTLEDIGEDRFGGGISYTFAVMPNGRVYEGHGIDRRGAHTGGRNSIARAIVLVGNHDRDPVTAAQVEVVAQLLVHGHRTGWWKHPRLNGGHRQAPGASTACPGRHGMAAIPRINARAAAIEAGATVSEEDDMYGDADRKVAEDTQVKANSAWVVADRTLAEVRDLAQQLNGLQAAVSTLAEAVASGRDDLTADELREAVSQGIQDAGAALRAAEQQGAQQ